MNESKWVAVGALSAAVAVGLGAFGAHGLEGKLPAESLDAFHVGVRYHLTHSIALILVGMLVSRWQGRATATAAVLLLGGILLFSGGLYAWGLTGVKALVHVVPVGGVAFIAGWIALAIAAWRR
jgi:uncharacterized membrane protein YgdD (TMEM256/DUF423 family)